MNVIRLLDVIKISNNILLFYDLYEKCYVVYEIYEQMFQEYILKTKFLKLKKILAENYN